MSGNNRQKKSSSFSLFSFFKGRTSRARRSGDDGRVDDYMRAYKVYPSDEDKGRWVAEPGIDKKAAAYITSQTDKWGKFDGANY